MGHASAGPNLISDPISIYLKKVKKKYKTSKILI
jgi:hypothetical protein